MPPSDSKFSVEDSYHLKPSPDPTLLTTQQLIRELAGLREIIETRLDGMDKAITLLQRTADMFPGRIDEKISSVSGVQDEKFRSIGTQFSERDTRTEQTSRDSKVAVDAALQAAKEAVGEQNRSSALAISKSEAATDKRIDQMAQLIVTTSGGLDGKISDVKERLTRLEGKNEGAKDQKVGVQNSSHLAIAGISIVIAVLSFAFAIFNMVKT